VNTVRRDKGLVHAKRLLQGFEFFRQLDPSIQAKVLDVVRHSPERRGRTLFREGDPPGNCYVVLSGKVAIWQSSDVDDAPQSPQLSARSVTPSDCGWGGSEDTGASQGRHSGLPAWPRGGPDEGALCDDHLAKEARERAFDMGCRTFGRQVAVVGAGELVGDVSIIHDQPRNATVVCMEDCEFLVIQRCDFERVLKQEMTRLSEEKCEFLRRHVPGVQRLSLPQAETIPYIFKPAVYPKGHVFCEQGAVAATKAIYIVRSGSVEVHHRDGTSELAGAHFGGRIKPGIGVRRVAVLPEGSLFGCGVSEDDEPEAFTVMAAGSSRCEVLQVPSYDFKRLPHSVQRSVERYLAQTAEFRRQQVTGPGGSCASSGSSAHRPRATLSSEPSSRTPSRPRAVSSSCGQVNTPPVTPQALRTPSKTRRMRAALAWEASRFEVDYVKCDPSMTPIAMMGRPPLSIKGGWGSRSLPTLIGASVSATAPGNPSKGRRRCAVVDMTAGCSPEA